VSLEFIEENQQMNILKRSEKSSTPKMYRFLVKKGIVKSEEQAAIVLLAISMVFFIAMFLVIYFNFFSAPQLSPQTKKINEAIKIYRDQGFSDNDIRIKIFKDKEVGRFE